MWNGIRDVSRRQHVIDGEIVAHERARVELRPLSRRHGHLRELLAGRAVLVHVPHRRHRVGTGGATDAKGHFELGGWQCGIESEAAAARPAAVPRREAGLAVRDQRDAAEPGGDRRGGVLDVDDEGRTAGHRAVGVLRDDAEVFADLRARHGADAGGEDAVDLRLVDAGVAQRVAGGLRVHHDRRHVRHDADLIRLVRTDDRDFVLECHLRS